MSDDHEVACRWVPPSAAPRVTSGITNTDRTTQAAPKHGVTCRQRSTDLHYHHDESQFEAIL